MMYVTLTNPGRAKKQIRLHVHEPLPNIDGLDEVEFLQADCDELEYILDTFQSSIPYCTHRVQCWFGDHAKFIYHNLQW